MDFSSFEPEDFAADEYFSEWVLNPGSESDAFWIDWIERHPEKRKDIDQARQIVLMARSDQNGFPSDGTIERLWTGITQRTARPDNVQRGFFLRLRPTLRIAASVAAILVIGLLIYRLSPYSNQVYATSYGDTMQCRLPDGTLVTLNANSILRVDRSWQKSGQRKVWLQGEAFFNVHPRIRDGKPVKFVVHTQDLSIEVKGTQFNVNTRKEQTRVVLSEGNIQLRLAEGNSSRTVRMKPGDLVDYSGRKQTLSLKRVADTTPLHSWKDHKWILEQTELSEVGTLIRETYGITVRFRGEALPGLKVTGIIPSDNLEDILGTLESILPVDIRKSSDEIIVEARNP